MRHFIQPRWLLLAGVCLCIAGWTINHFTRQEGKILLQSGMTKKLINADLTDTAAVDAAQISLTLDSVVVQPHTPEFEIISWLNASPDNPHQTMGLPEGEEQPTDRYPLEIMKIHRLGETDYYFRVKDFYPNFEFAYSYPSDRDTLTAKAPGITLELQTPSGKSIVTLGQQKPYKNRLDDIVGLGTALVYFWNTDTDSLKKALLKSTAGKTWVFLGEKQMVCRVSGDSLIEQPLSENTFYPTGDVDSVGFKVMFAFPDAAYLKAEPASKGTEVLNPVARVEIWKEGQGAAEAYLYPEGAGKKGGKYGVKGSGYTLGLSTLSETTLQHCSCNLMVRRNDASEEQQISLQGKRPVTVDGYTLKLKDCYQGHQAVSLQVTRQKGSLLTILGLGVVVLAGFFYFSKRKLTT